MKLKNKKAQIITFDFSTSLIVFLIFLIIFIGIFLLSQTAERKYDFELEYVFGNLENNLQYDAIANPGSNRDFFRDYRIDITKLYKFALDIGTGSVDDYVVGNISLAHGIGLSSEAYDVCLYFTDNNKEHLVLSSSGTSPQALGALKNSKNCNEEITNKRNPCEDYKQALSLFKPVLLDEGRYSDNRIIQMNLVICKK